MGVYRSLILLPLRASASAATPRRVRVVDMTVPSAAAAAAAAAALLAVLTASAAASFHQQRGSDDDDNDDSARISSIAFYCACDDAPAIIATATMRIPPLPLLPFSSFRHSNVGVPPWHAIAGACGATTTRCCEASEQQQRDDVVVEQEDAATHPNNDTLVLPAAGLGGGGGDKYYYCYERIVDLPDRATASTHAIYGALMWHDDKNLVQRYEVYRYSSSSTTTTPPTPPAASLRSATTDTTTTTTRQSGPPPPPPDVVAVVTFGHGLDGHFGIVHGGILALLIDDVLGFGCEESSSSVMLQNNNGQQQQQIAVTANLNVDYKAPVPAGSTVLIAATLRATEKNRKLYWDVIVTSTDRSVTYCRATSLYVLVGVSRQQRLHSGNDDHTTTTSNTKTTTSATTMHSVG